MLDQSKCDGSGWETEYVWGTCVEHTPKYLRNCSSLAQDESVEAFKYLARVYKRQFELCFGVCCLTNTHVMAVVGTTNMCGVPVQSILPNTSILEAVWHKLTAHKQSNLHPGCINVNFSASWMVFAGQIHMRRQYLGDRICVGYLCRA